MTHGHIVGSVLPIWFQSRASRNSNRLGLSWADTVRAVRIGGLVRFKILGSLAVEGEGGPLVVSGVRRRALLLRLLVPPNHPVSDDRLTDDLWDGEPPAGAASTLASHVSLLRQVIGRDRIARRAGGYVLVVGHEEVDALCFEEEAKAGDAAFGEGRVELARRLFEAALERWRGPALMDVHDMSWASGETTRLEELRRTSQESLMDARLALGEHHQLVAALESAVAEDPLRERRWRQLMIALYRSGRQADALHAYQRLRLFLGDQLGIEPSAELTLLEHSIILQKPELDWEGTNPWLAGDAGSRARGATCPDLLGPEGLASGSTSLCPAVWVIGPRPMSSDVRPRRR